MATKEQLAEALKRAHAAGDVDAAKILAGEYAKVRADAYKPQPDSFGKRALMGAGEMVVGAGQLVSRGLANVPSLVDKAPGVVGIAAKAAMKIPGVRGYLEELPQRNDAAARDYTSRQEQGAPDGVDWGRMLGGAVATAPAMLVTGGGATLPALARAGATSGAAVGAFTPTGGDDFGANKTTQVGAGAVGGAVLGPVVGKAVGALGSGLRSIAAKLNPSTPLPQIQIQIENILQQAGVDLRQLPQGYAKTVAQGVQTAVSQGGTLDDAAIANIASGKSLGIDLTRGQATQNPMQYGNEMFLRQAPGGDELATQYTGALSKLNQGLTDVSRNMPPATLNVDAGRKAIEALKAADMPTKQRVDALYQAARAKVGVTTPLDQRTFADTAMTRLQEAGLSDKLPAQFVSALNTVSTGKAPLTMREAQMMIRAANGRYGASSDKAERQALRIFKDSLDESIDAAGSAQGQEAAAAFKAAREAASKRFQRIDKIPGLRDVLDGDAVPDTFLKAHVYGSKLDDLRNLRAYLGRESPAAWDQIRAQVLSDLRKIASGGDESGGKFMQAQYNKALNSLAESGKLPYLFKPSEVSTLRNIGKVGRLVQEGPAGVSRTGLAGAAKGIQLLTGLLSQITPRLGGLADAAAKKGGNIVNATVAVTPPPLTRGIPPAVRPQTLNALSRLGGTLPPVFDGVD